MKRLLLLLLAVPASYVLIHLTNPSRAHACTPDEDWNPVDDSEIIVAGRITRWELIDKVTQRDPKPAEPVVDDPRYHGGYEPIRLHLEVDHTYKGSPVTSIDVVDAVSLEVYDGAQEWAGSAACATFDSDPRGQYVILGINRDELGGYQTSFLGLFFIGPEPVGERYERAIDRATSESREYFLWFLAGVGATIMLPAVLGGAYLWRRGGGSVN